MVDQLIADLKFCIEELGCNDDQIAELITVSDEMGISVEYFWEEFIVTESTSVHQDEYLSIEEFEELCTEEVEE